MSEAEDKMKMRVKLARNNATCINFGFEGDARDNYDEIDFSAKRESQNCEKNRYKRGQRQ